MFIVQRLGFALVLTLLAATGVHAASDCFEDNADGQLAAGKLSVIKAEDAAGRPERPYILALPEAACLSTDDPDSQVDATETIHIYATDPSLANRIAALVGKFVIVKGHPFAAHTAHHHAPIVMEISDITPN